MGIRQPAAEKLVRQLLELRLTRLTALSDEFIATMGKMVVAFVDMDEQRQRSEEIMDETEELAFAMPPPNTHAPLFIEACSYVRSQIAIVDAARNAAQHSSSEENK